MQKIQKNVGWSELLLPIVLASLYRTAPPPPLREKLDGIVMNLKILIFNVNKKIAEQIVQNSQVLLSYLLH